MKIRTSGLKLEARANNDPEAPPHPPHTKKNQGENDQLFQMLLLGKKDKNSKWTIAFSKVEIFGDFGKRCFTGVVP